MEAVGKADFQWLAGIPLASEITGASPEEARASVGKTIKKARTRCGLTAQQVGERMDPPVTGAAVTSWERGRTTPGAEARAQLEEILADGLGAPVMFDTGKANGLTIEYDSGRPHVEYAIVSLDDDPSRRAGIDRLLERVDGLSPEGIWKLCEQAELLAYRYPKKEDGGKAGGAS